MTGERGWVLFWFVGTALMAALFFGVRWLLIVARRRIARTATAQRLGHAVDKASDKIGNSGFVRRGGEVAGRAAGAIGDGLGAAFKMLSRVINVAMVILGFLLMVWAAVSLIRWFWRNPIF
jgi:hypothetical protein